jgi:hypothetical protein
MTMDTQNDLLIPITYNLPYALDITLYKYNYIDSLLLSYIRKETRSHKIEGDAIIVNAPELKELIEEKFGSDINKIKSMSANSLADNVNSAYFIDKILTNFNNLRYVKVNISNNRNFSRVINTAEKKIINFDYKIITSVLDFTKYVENDNELKSINNLLYTVGILKDDGFGEFRKPYIIISTNDFMNLLNGIESELDDDITSSIYLEPLELIYDLIDQKSETDNTNLIIITDYPD